MQLGQLHILANQTKINEGQISIPVFAVCLVAKKHSSQMCVFYETEIQANLFHMTSQHHVTVMRPPYMSLYKQCLNSQEPILWKIL